MHSLHVAAHRLFLYVNAQYAFDTGKKAYERVDRKRAIGGAMLIAAGTHQIRRL